MADTILTDDADVRYSYDRIQTQGYLSGHVVGLDAAARWLRDRAVVLFRHGRDDLAKQLRDLADQMVHDLRPDMEAAAQQYEHDFPAVIEKE